MKDVQTVCYVLSAYLCRQERLGLPIGQMELGSFLTSLAGPALGFKLGREAEEWSKPGIRCLKLLCSLGGHST